MLLNALPHEVSGLGHILQASGADQLSDEAMRLMGFTKADITNFYYYVLLSEIMSKIDGVVKKTISMVSIFDTEGKTRPEGHDIYMAGTVGSLAMLVNSQAKRLPEDPGLIHPIQEVIKTVGRKVLSILNMFSGSAIDFLGLIHSPLMSVLNFSLDKKAGYSAGPDSPLGDRRVLEKALRLLFRTLKSDGSRNISFTGKIEGVTQLWLVSVTLGGKLVVAPHVPKLQSITMGGSPRLVQATRTASFGSFISGAPDPKSTPKHTDK